MSEWCLPIHTVETIIVSVISMLTEPNDESTANVDAVVSIYRGRGRGKGWEGAKSLRQSGGYLYKQ